MNLGIPFLIVCLLAIAGSLASAISKRRAARFRKDWQEMVQETEQETEFVSAINKALWVHHEDTFERLAQHYNEDSKDFQLAFDLLHRELLTEVRNTSELSQTQREKISRAEMMRELESVAPGLRKRDAEVEVSLDEVICSHLDALRRKFRQSVFRDDYGRDVLDSWNKELDYFIDKVIKEESLHAYIEWRLGESQELRSRCKRMIEGKVQQSLKNAPEVCNEFHPSMSGIEFERFCADELRKGGWEARLTKASGDQGVDIVATKDGIRMVVQCKVYSQPVGNDAVQEVVAGKLHEGANVGCVVSNQPFTRAARELAATTGVELVHFSELCDLSFMRSSTTDEGVIELTKVVEEG